ncbi:TadE family type IV pilus minor pilin [Alteromonas gracilis]
MSAETAAVLPLMVVVAVGLCWLVGLAVVQMRVTDAAREAARLVARGEPEGAAMSIARRVAPEGSRATVTSGSGTVVVRVEAPVRGPAGVFSAWGGFDIDAEAVASVEPGR